MGKTVVTLDRIRKDWGLRWLSGLLCAVLLVGGTAFGQSWQSVGADLSASVSAMEVDSSTNTLYVAGSFCLGNDSVLKQVASWDASVFHPLGVGTGDPNCNSGGLLGIWNMAAHDGFLFVSGAHRWMGGDPAGRNLSRWVGTQWSACGSPNAYSYLESSDGGLLAFGAFDSIYGQGSGMIRQYQSGTWVPFPGQLLQSATDGNYRCARKYHGDWYFGGNFTYGAYREIAAWTADSRWEDVGGGIRGDAWLNELEVFGDLLWVGGEFYGSDGNAADFLQVWNGSIWDSPLQGVYFIGQVQDMRVMDGALYIAALHFLLTPNGMEGPFPLGRYDGHQFCSLGDAGLYQVYRTAMWNGDLYAATDRMVNGDTMGHLMKYIGNPSSNCISAPLSVESPHGRQAVVLSPNPAVDRFSLRFKEEDDEPATLLVMDMGGRVVMGERSYRAGDPPVDVSMLPAGVYVVQVRTRAGVENIKLVVN